MKKIFLTTIALLSMASATIFGMYGPDSDWIFFLTDGNRFRARADQLGFTLGNDTIKGTFGFRNKGFGGQFGKMLNTTDGVNYNFNPTISMGLGYTSSLISVGVGYNATIGSQRWTKYNGKAEGKKTEAVAHTPVLVLNAMDNAFRMAIPIQVYADGDTNAVSVDSQFRYYTGLDMFPEIRLYLRYGSFTTKTGGVTSKEGESFGFDFRLYFGSMVEEVALKPYVKLVYNGALGKYHDNTRVEAVKVMKKQQSGSSIIFAKNAWILNLVAGLGLSANSDIVSLYLEPSLGLTVNQAGSIDKNAKETYGLGYDVYAEIYITPLKNLEWYFEASIGNVGNTKGVAFASSTGITWYLPAL